MFSQNKLANLCSPLLIHPDPGQRSSDKSIMTNVSYFRKLVVDETAKLNGLCDKWTVLAAENENIPETSRFAFTTPHDFQRFELE